jgi:hypothetical protein
VACTTERGVFDMSTTLHGTLLALGIPHVWKDYGAGCHGIPEFQKEFAESLPGIEAAFLHPRPAPKAFTYKSIEPHFTIWGWRVDTDPQRPLEFLQLTDAGRRGVTLTGSGATRVTTPPFFRGRRAVDVTTTQGTRRIKPGRGGRLRFSVDLVGTPQSVRFAPRAKRATAAGAPRPITIRTRSNRADLISDGQALVAIRLPRGARAAGLRVRLGKRNVTKAFSHRTGRRLEGVVKGLRLGRNRLVATAPGTRGARLTITNHPNGGPVFSGPQLQPWKCQKAAVDAQCNQPPEFTYLYKSTDPSQPSLQPYDPKSPPDDVATTTTDAGKTVPFIVRQELGYQDRDQYKFLTLFTPGKAWTRWRPQPQWNHKLVITGGGGCGIGYGASNAPLDDLSGTLPAPVPGYTHSYINALGKGFAVMSTALDNTGHNCNLAVEAESLIMAKERLIENYGDVRYTIGTGCSGGSIVQQTVANAYPRAVYDGLVITCAYPDVLTAGAQFADYHLLRLYFEDPSKWHGVFWAPVLWGLVEGRPDHANAVVADEGLFKDAVQPVGDCVPPEQAYNPQTNPGGVRCSILDGMINILGPRPASVWSEMEKKAGHGFAGQPFGNQGIEYGRRELEQGLITPAQFADLNAAVGGADIDVKPTAARLPGDDGAVVNAYRSGLVNEFNHMSGVAIIDHAGPDPGIAHDYAHSWWIRDRLDRAQGHHGNFVLWYGPTPLVGGPRWPTKALIAMDEWLAAVEHDHSGVPRAQKIVDDRPGDVRDKCVAKACESYAATRYSSPRQEAGGSELNDTDKCRLKPLRRDDYSVTFADADWAKLEQAFPDGVCDWSRPGVGQQENLSWLTYQDADGHVVYGGTPMGRAPRSVALT